MKLIGKYTPVMFYDGDKLYIRDESGEHSEGNLSPQLTAGYFDFDGYSGEFSYLWDQGDILKYFKGFRGDAWFLEVFMHYSTDTNNTTLFESGSYKVYIDTSGQLRFQNYYLSPTGVEDLILGDLSAHDGDWIKVQTIVDGGNISAFIDGTSIFQGTILPFVNGVQFPTFTISDRFQASKQSISYVKLVTNRYRFLWTFDYMGLPGGNNIDRLALDLSMNAVHLSPSSVPAETNYKRSGQLGNHPKAPSLLNFLGYYFNSGLYEPLKIDGSKSAQTLSTEFSKGKIPNTGQIISADCGYHGTSLREIKYTNPALSGYYDSDFCMGTMFQKSDLKSSSGHQLLFHQGGNWNTATHIIGARFNSNNDEITMYFKAPGLATLPDISHTSFADDDPLLFVISRTDGVIRVTLEKIGDVSSRVTVELNIDNDLSGNTYPFVIGSYGDVAAEFLQNTKVMATFLSDRGLTIDELDLISLNRYYPTDLKVIFPINEGSGTTIYNHGTLAGTGALNNGSGYWSSQDAIHISALTLQPEPGKVSMMRFFKTESKINFDVYGTYEMGIINAGQTIDMKSYSFGDAVVPPVSIIRRSPDNIDKYETQFKIEYSSDIVVLMTDEERHDYISMNGKSPYNRNLLT